MKKRFLMAFIALVLAVQMIGGGLVAQAVSIGIDREVIGTTGGDGQQTSEPATPAPQPSEPQQTAGPGEAMLPAALGKPLGLRWEGNTARWNAAANAASYVIYLYKEGAKAAGPFTVDAASSELSYDFGAVMGLSGNGVYTFDVMAMRGAETAASAQSSALVYGFSGAPATAPINLTTAKADTSGAGWTWNAASKTLTLDGANIEVENGDAITLPSGSKVVTKSSSSVRAKNGAAIRAQGNITIEKDATAPANAAMVVEGSQGGIYATGALVVNSGAISAAGTGAGASGIQAGSVNVGTNATLKAFGGEKGKSVSSDGEFTLSAGSVFYGATADGSGGVSAQKGASTKPSFAAGSVVYVNTDTQETSGDTSAVGDTAAAVAQKIQKAAPETAATVQMPAPRKAAAAAPRAAKNIGIVLTGKATSKYYGQEDPPFLDESNGYCSFTGLSSGDTVVGALKYYATGSKTGTFNFDISGLTLTNGGVTQDAKFMTNPAGFTIKPYNTTAEATVQNGKKAGSWWILEDDNKPSQGQIIVEAPEGYYISTTDDPANFGTKESLTISSNVPGFQENITYYLRAKAGTSEPEGAISAAKNLNVDLQRPAKGSLTYQSTGDTWLDSILNFLTFGLAGNRAL